MNDELVSRLPSDSHPLNTVQWATWLVKVYLVKHYSSLGMVAVL